MKSLKALIIDDETTAIQTLSLMIKHYLPEITMVETTTDAVKGLQLISCFEPQLLFIDIHMPVMSGFELLKRVPHINFSIIFTTAHDEYAIDAIRFSALDYLLKPIDADELQQAFGRFKQQIAQRAVQLPLYHNFIYNLQVSNRKDFKLALVTLTSTFFYKPDEIIRLEGEGNYTRFHFANKTALLTSHTIRHYEDILLNYGFRVHKSHLVNKMHVVNCLSNCMLTMSDLSNVEISRRRREEVLDALKNG